MASGTSGQAVDREIARAREPLPVGPPSSLSRDIERSIDVRFLPRHNTVVHRSSTGTGCIISQSFPCAHVKSCTVLETTCSMQFGATGVLPKLCKECSCWPDQFACSALQRTEGDKLFGNGSKTKSNGNGKGHHNQLLNFDSASFQPLLRLRKKVRRDMCITAWCLVTLPACFSTTYCQSSSSGPNTSPLHRSSIMVLCLWITTGVIVPTLSIHSVI